MKHPEKPLVRAHYLLEKMPGKGGWTYARIPEIPQDKKAPFGWRKVKGSIDGYVISKYHLMPMGNGQLFLPVKADIRKRIGKKAGDTVEVVLYADNEPVEVPADMLACLQDEPAALRAFEQLPDAEKEQMIKWIYAAKTEHLRVVRIAQKINAPTSRKI